MHIDEHMMAGYLSGELNDQERAGVTAALLTDKGLREWLTMATEAMAAAQAGENEGIMSRLMPRMNSSRPGIRREDRRALPNAFRKRQVG